MPGNLAEIFPLRFRLREELRFFPYGEAVIAERVKTGQRYSLKRWQYELLLRFDGRTTYEQAAREEYRVRPAGFTALGLLNFYNWLYSENLVVCECESIFELVLGESPEEGVRYRGAASDEMEPGFIAQLLHDSRVRKVAIGAAAALLVFSVIRITYVAAPVLEPPVQKLYAEASRLSETPAAEPSSVESQRGPAEPDMERVSLASKVSEIPAAPDPAIPIEKATPAPAVAPAPPQEVQAQPEPRSQPQQPTMTGVSASLKRIEQLRIQLEECRVRRDEFYLQNDEEGYRREVHRMTNIAREIGDIENSL